MGLNMVEFQEGLFRAPPSGERNEGTLAGVAPPGRALDRARDIARADSRFPN